MMQTWLDFFAGMDSLEVNLSNSIFRLLLSMALGMAVGAERKQKGQIAGIRTFSLISMGACLAMLLSIYVPQAYLGLKNGDPGRIAAQVITGIGFIGGGAMIHLKGAVKGLTTAAGIWMTAIIGMAVGVGMYMISLSATMLILLTLIAFERYEKKRKLGQVTKVISLTVEGIVDDIDPYKNVMRKDGTRLSTFFIEYDYDKKETELNFVVLAHAYTDLMPLLKDMGCVRKTKRLTLTNQIDI